MRLSNSFLIAGLTLTLGLAANVAMAQTNPSRTANAPQVTPINENPQLQILTDDLNSYLSGFLQTTQNRVQVLQQTVNATGTEVLNLCRLLYQTLVAHGYAINTQISVPDPNANLTPAQIQQFCRNVINIPQLPGGGTTVTITPPFVTTMVPPVCDLQREDLAWQNNRWVCVNTRPATCASSPTPPVWTPVLGGGN